MKSNKSNIQDLPKYVHAVSGKFIAIDGKVVRSDYVYKDFKRFELCWNSEGASSLTFWDDEGKHEQPFKNTKTDFNKYVKPLVKIFEQNVGKIDRKSFDAKVRQLNERIFIAKLNEDLDLLEDLLLQRKNVSEYKLIKFCPLCGKELDKCTCITCI